MKCFVKFYTNFLNTICLLLSVRPEKEDGGQGRQGDARRSGRRQNRKLPPTQDGGAHDPEQVQAAVQDHDGGPEEASERVEPLEVEAIHIG